MIGIVGKDFFAKSYKQVMNCEEKPCLIDGVNRKIYYPSDFLRKEGPQSLYWNRLGHLHNNSRLGRDVCATGGIDLFLSSLLDHLVKKNLFTIGTIDDLPCIGDYVNGLCIDLSHPYQLVGPRMSDTRLKYYPRKKEDAEAIAKSFFSDTKPAFVYQVMSVQNIDRDASLNTLREFYDSSPHVNDILDRNIKLRADFLRTINLRHSDLKFINAEY
jgi:hypothetical protein